MNGETILFVGGHFEFNDTTDEVTKYYFAGASRIAMRKYTVPQSMTLEYFLGDHLGSTSITTDTTGAKVSEMRYEPWGEVRYHWVDKNLSTTPAYKLPVYTFTGQRSYMDDPSTSGMEGFGLMDYNARMYDPQVGRFAQADTVVPGGVQGLDRYAYVNNSPINFTDTTGHFTDEELEAWLLETYGSNWKEVIDPTLYHYLKRAQSGDVLQYGKDGYVMFVQNEDGMLSIWSIGNSIDENQFISFDNLKSMFNSRESALYRPVTAGDGSSDSTWDINGPGEGIGDPWYGNTPYEKIESQYCSEDICGSTYNLPDRWYQDNTGRINVDSGPVGWGASWVGTGLAGIGVWTSVGGNPLIGIPSLIVGVVDMLTWDTSYRYQPGSIIPPPQPIPTP